MPRTEASERRFLGWSGLPLFLLWVAAPAPLYIWLLVWLLLR